MAITIGAKMPDELTPDERKKLNDFLEHALTQPDDTLAKNLGELLLRLTPPDNH